MKSRVRPFAERLETDRLVLRKYRPEDAVWYCEVACRNHRHLARHESGNPAFGIGSVADAAAVLAAMLGDWEARKAFFLGAFLKESGIFVAQIYVGVANAPLPGFTLGFFADRRHEGNGYVTEAARAVLRHLFTRLRAHRVTLWCDDTNRRSRRVAERCGFVREGHLRQDKRHRDGSITGSFCYGLLRPKASRRT